MANEIFQKEQTPLVVTSSGGSLADQVAVSAGTADLRSTGGGVGAFVGQAELYAKWATVTGLIARLPLCDLFFVPAIDGTNHADVDVSAGYIPGQYRCGSFTAHMQLVSNTMYRFGTAQFPLFPTLGKFYLANRSGQTMQGSGTWTLTIGLARGGYN